MFETMKYKSRNYK